MFGNEAVPEIVASTDSSMTEEEAEDMGALLFFVLDYKEDIDLLVDGQYNMFVAKHVQWPADAHICLSRYFPQLSSQVTHRALASVGEEHRG